MTKYLLIIFLLFGCASKKNFHYVVDVPAMRVHCVSDSDQMPKNGKCEDKQGCVKDGEMWLLCDKWEDTIVPYSGVLWHEYQHCLNKSSDGLILDPDEMFSLDFIKLSP